MVDDDVIAISQTERERPNLYICRAAVIAADFAQQWRNRFAVPAACDEPVEQGIPVKAAIDTDGAGVQPAFIDTMPVQAQLLSPGDYLLQQTCHLLFG